MKKKFIIKGMTCASCQAHVQKAVDSLDGITSCNVNLLSNNMDVEYNENILNDEKIIQAVNDAGYEAIIPDEKVIKINEKDYTLAKLITSIVLLLILMYFSMGNMMWGWVSPSIFDHHHNPMGFSLLQFILVLPITYIYRNYFISGFKKLFKGHPNMDSLIAIGATFSLVYGIIALFMISYGTRRIWMDLVSNLFDVYLYRGISDGTSIFFRYWSNHYHSIIDLCFYVNKTNLLWFILLR